MLPPPGSRRWCRASISGPETIDPLGSPVSCLLVGTLRQYLPFQCPLGNKITLSKTTAYGGFHFWNDGDHLCFLFSMCPSRSVLLPGRLALQGRHHPAPLPSGSCWDQPRGTSGGQRLEPSGCFFSLPLPGRGFGRGRIPVTIAPARFWGLFLPLLLLALERSSVFIP